MKTTGQLVAGVRATGITIGLAGARTAEVSVGTVVLATGGAAALVIGAVSLGRWLASRDR